MLPALVTVIHRRVLRQRRRWRGLAQLRRARRRSAVRRVRCASAAVEVARAIWKAGFLDRLRTLPIASATVLAGCVASLLRNLLYSGGAAMA